MKNKLLKNDVKPGVPGNVSIENKEIVLYQSESGALEIAVDSKNETLLLTQQQVAMLFGTQKAAISKHVKNIFGSSELEKESTVSILETIQKEGY